MINLLWTLLNIGILIFFIIICLKATKIIRERIGLFASVIFVFGLLSFAGNSAQKDDSNQDENRKIKSWNYNLQDKVKRNTTRTSIITIDKNITSTTDLFVQYGENIETNNDIPIEASTIVTGFVSGHYWKPDIILIDTTSVPDKLSYKVIGTIRWKLLGSSIYSQSKTYKGTFETTK